MSLNLSRALGDVLMKRPRPVISSDPDIHVKEIRSPFTLVIASDGVFSRLSSKDVGRFLKLKRAKTGANCKKLAKLLVDHAYDKGSWDNISAIVVRVMMNKTEWGGAETKIM